MWYFHQTVGWSSATLWIFVLLSFIFVSKFSYQNSTLLSCLVVRQNGKLFSVYQMDWWSMMLIANLICTTSICTFIISIYLYHVCRSAQYYILWPFPIICFNSILNTVWTLLSTLSKLSVRLPDHSNNNFHYKDKSHLNLKPRFFPR